MGLLLGSLGLLEVLSELGDRHVENTRKYKAKKEEERKKNDVYHRIDRMYGEEFDRECERSFIENGRFIDKVLDEDTERYKSKYAYEQAVDIELRNRMLQVINIMNYYNPQIAGLLTMRLQSGIYQYEDILRYHGYNPDQLNIFKTDLNYIR